MISPRTPQEKVAYYQGYLAALKHAQAKPKTIPMIRAFMEAELARATEEAATTPRPTSDIDPYMRIKRPFN